MSPALGVNLTDPFMAKKEVLSQVTESPLSLPWHRSVLTKVEPPLFLIPLFHRHGHQCSLVLASSQMQCDARRQRLLERYQILSGLH